VVILRRFDTTTSDFKKDITNITRDPLSVISRIRFDPYFKYENTSGITALKAWSHTELAVVRMSNKLACSLQKVVGIEIIASKISL